MKWRLTSNGDRPFDHGTFSSQQEAERAKNADAAQNVKEGNTVPTYNITPVADNDNEPPKK